MSVCTRARWDRRVPMLIVLGVAIGALDVGRLGREEGDLGVGSCVAIVRTCVDVAGFDYCWESCQGRERKVVWDFTRRTVWEKASNGRGVCETPMT